MNQSRPTSGDETSLLRAELLELRAELIRLKARIARLETSSSRWWRLQGPLLVGQTLLLHPVAWLLALGTEWIPNVTTPGRDALPQASRYWVVIRTFEGVVYNPSKLYTKFGACRSLVKRGTDCGEAVFIGLPSRLDVDTALRAGGFALPATAEQ